MMKHTPYGKPVETSPGTAQVTFSTKQRSVAPGYIRARVAIAGHFDIVSTRMTQPRIVAQAEDSSWMTWESRLLADTEPDSVRA